MKNTQQLVVNTLFALICAFFANKASFAEPPNLGLLKEQVQTYHDSGIYDKEVAQVMKQAHDYVVQRVQANEHSQQRQKLAIVLDIDETSLTNYNKMVARHFTDNRARIHKDILAADAPAMNAMLSFYNDALKRGVSIFFVTGRHEDQRAATIRNLKAAGYHDWAGIYLKPNHYTFESVAPFKTEARATITKQGYRVIASIGDQLSDLVGGYAEKTFKLPNPYYYLR